MPDSRLQGGYVGIADQGLWVLANQIKVDFIQQAQPAPTAAGTENHIHGRIGEHAV